MLQWERAVRMVADQLNGDRSVTQSGRPNGSLLVLGSAGTRCAGGLLSLFLAKEAPACFCRGARSDPLVEAGEQSRGALAMSWRLLSVLAAESG